MKSCLCNSLGGEHIQKLLKWYNSEKIENETAFGVVFGYFFDVANDSICLLILEFLEKAEDEIDEEEALD